MRHGVGVGQGRVRIGHLYVGVVDNLATAVEGTAYHMHFSKAGGSYAEAPSDSGAHQFWYMVLFRREVYGQCFHLCFINAAFLVLFY